MANNNRSWLDYVDGAVSTAMQYLDAPFQYAAGKLSQGQKAVSTYLDNDLKKYPKLAAVIANDKKKAEQYKARVRALPAPVQAGLNFVPSAMSETGNIISGVGQTAAKPFETGAALAKTASSGLAYALDKSLNAAGVNPVPYSTQRVLEAPVRRFGAQATSDFRDPQGNLSLDALGRNLIEKPGAMAVDVASLLAPVGDVAELGANAARLVGSKAGSVAQGARIGSAVERGAQAVANAANATGTRVGNVASGLKTAGQVLNPVNVVTKPVAAVAKAVSPAAKIFANNSIYRMGDEANGLHGAFEEKANAPVNENDAINGAQVPEGLKSSDRIQANPDLRASVEAAVNEKGLTPQAIAEGEAAHHGVALTREQLEGTTTNPERVRQDAAMAKEKLAASAATKSPLPIEDPLHQASGQAFINAAGESLADARQGYEDLSRIPGEFDKSNFADRLNQELNQGIESPLNTHGITSTEDIFNDPALKGSARAYNFIADEMRNNEPLTLARINRLRSSVGSLGTNGTDDLLIDTIKNSLTNTADHLLKEDLENRQSGLGESHDYNFDNGIADPTAAQEATQNAVGKIQDANTRWAIHQQTFGPKGDYGHIVRTLGNDAKPIIEGGVVPTKEQLSTVGRALADDVIDPKLKHSSFDALDNLGDIDPRLAASVANGIKYRIANGLSNGATGADTLSALDKFGPIFAPEDSAHIASAADIHDLVDAPVRRDFSAYKNAAAAMGKHVLGTTTGALIGGSRNPFLGAVGAVVGDRLISPSEPDRQAMGAAPALNAPAQVLNAGKSAAQTVEKASPYAPAAAMAAQAGQTPAAPTGVPTTEAEAKAMGYEEVPSSVPSTEAQAKAMGYEEVPEHASGGRVGYKSGGSVSVRDIEPLVQSLMRKAKSAKIQSNKVTEPLLNRDDSAIVRALDVAQKAI